MNPARILIVEDDKDLREVYSLVLRHNGYDICTANDGQEALTEIQDCQPKLVLLDIFMPRMDGREFLERIDLSDYPGMKVVVCSNTSDQGLMDSMLKLGAERVVTKASLAPTDLVSLVEPYVG